MLTNCVSAKTKVLGPKRPLDSSRVNQRVNRVLTESFNSRCITPHALLARNQKAEACPAEAHTTEAGLCIVLGPRLARAVMSPLTVLVKSRFEILHLNVRTGMDVGSDKFAALCRDAHEAIRQVSLGVPSVSADEVVELLGILADAPVTEEVKGDLRDPGMRCQAEQRPHALARLAQAPVCSAAMATPRFQISRTVSNSSPKGYDQL